MKKSTIILIAAIYVASIVIVGVFGLKALIYEEKVYVDKIQFVDPVTGENYKFLGEEIKPDSSGDGYIVRVNYKEGQTTDGLMFVVTPTDASNTKVEIVVESVTGKESNPCAKLESAGLGYRVTFSRKGIITLRIKATDGSKVSTVLRISAM